MSYQESHFTTQDCRYLPKRGKTEIVCSCLHVFFFSFSLKGRGGQSALRFARLRMEKRHNYVRKVAETAVQLYITNDRVSAL